MLAFGRTLIYVFEIWDWDSYTFQCALCIMVYVGLYFIGLFGLLFALPFLWSCLMTIEDHHQRRHRCTWKHLETDSSVASTKAERCFTWRKLLIAVINGFHTRLRRVEGPRDALCQLKSCRRLQSYIKNHTPEMKSVFSFKEIKKRSRPTC